MREAFLSRRSPFFKHKIRQWQESGSADDVTLGDVSWETFCLFWEWSYMKEPAIPRFTSLDEVLDLGIMATQYEVRALQHEASDLLRQNISRKTWKLGPSQVTRMLSGADGSPWLQRLAYASLCTVARPQSMDKAVEVEEWLAVLDRHPALAREWKRSDFLGLSYGSIADGGPCRFHDHGPDYRGEDSAQSCPHRQAELYPVAEERRQGSRQSKARRRFRFKRDSTPIAAEEPAADPPTDAFDEAIVVEREM